MARHCFMPWNYIYENRVVKTNKKSQINKGSIKKDKFLPAMIGVNELTNIVRPHHSLWILMVQCQWLPREPNDPDHTRNQGFSLCLRERKFSFSLLVDIDRSAARPHCLWRWFCDWRESRFRMNQKLSTTMGVPTARPKSICSQLPVCFVISDSCDPMDCSSQGSSVHGLFQARILEWVAVYHSRGSPNPGIKPASPGSPASEGGFFTTSATWVGVWLSRWEIHPWSSTGQTA